MNKGKSLLSAILLAGVSSFAWAQHAGHGGGSGLGHAGHEPSIEELQKKMRIQATSEQRAQLRTCLELSERLRTMAATMKKPAGLSESEAAPVSKQWRNSLLQVMHQSHQDFLESLSVDQQTALKGRLKRLEQVTSELNSRFETVDRDLATPVPNARRVADHAKELEKSLKKWQKQHREIGTEIGIES